MTFRAALNAVYRDNPCQALPNPLWKTLALFGNAAPIVGRDPQSGAVNHLELGDSRRLFVYWDRDRTRWTVAPERLARLDTLLVHQDFSAAVPRAGFAVQRAYFRLLWRGPAPAPPALPPGVALRPVAVPAEAQQVAELLCACYAWLRLDAATVRRWAALPVFAAEGWVWAVDTASGAPIGLGIADIDPAMGEGAIEWLQVLPAHRGRGIGAALVGALLDRLAPRSAFVTVAGECANPTQPERLYRRCGFSGADVWWFLSRSR